MGDNLVYIRIDERWEYPIHVTILVPPFSSLSDYNLDGEFDFDHIDYLWGMLKQFSDAEDIELKDLRIKIFNKNLCEYDDFYSRMRILKTKDGENWFDVPERFKYSE